MKRAAALQPLSRDHLKALIVAKALREASDEQAGRERLLEFWALEHSHFRIEEEVLLPAWAAGGELDEAMAVRTLTDHLFIRAQTVRLQDGELPLEELHALGQRLHDHVRFEERTLFPLIERQLDEAALTRLGAAIAAAHHD